MTTRSFELSLEKIRSQIDQLKERLENIDKVLNVQEEAINLLHENTKALLQEATVSYNNTDSTEEIMKKFFSTGKLPKILYKK